jgi:hypothetical protein
MQFNANPKTPDYKGNSGLYLIYKKGENKWIRGRIGQIDYTLISAPGLELHFRNAALDEYLQNIFNADE